MVHDEIERGFVERMREIIRQLEDEGAVSRTFRRLDPGRKQSVVDAIVEEAADRGPGGLSMKRVAGKAGVSVGSLYQYFEDRGKLLAFAVEICVRTMAALFEESRPYLAAMPLKDAFSAYLSTGIEWSRTRAAFVRLFCRAAYSGDPDLSDTLVRPIATMMRTMVGDIVAAAAARGETRAGMDAEAAARALNVLFIGIGDSVLMPHINAYFQATDRAVPADRVISAAVDLALSGIGAA
jgi:AcrR family transcriptional regulator